MEPSQEKVLEAHQADNGSAGHLTSPEDGHPREKETREVTGPKWFIFVTATFTAMFLYSLDNTIVANIQPTIVNNFNAVDELPWLSVGFMVGGLAMVMPLGKLYSLFNGKWLFVMFVVQFMAASALCGGAPNMTAEIIGRTWAGASGNGIYYGVIHLVSTITLPRERPAYLSLNGLVWGMGAILGPIVGGSLELVSWRWAFYINLFFAIPLFPAYIFTIPSSQPAPHLSIKQKLVTFDWIGALLSTGSLLTFIVATNFGGLEYRWNSGPIIALYAVSGVLFLTFAIQQTFTIFTTPDSRMFPVHLLRNREVVLLFIIHACGGTISYVPVYFVPLYFQFTRGDTAVETAARFLPFVFLLIFGILLNGYLMSRVGYYKPWFVFGSVLCVVAGVLFSRIELTTSNPAIYGYEALLGLGAGCFVAAAFAVVQANVDLKDLGYAITLMTVAQIGGIAFGLSMSGATFLNIAIQNLAGVFPDETRETLVDVVSGTSGDFLQTLSDQKATEALDAIVRAIQVPFIQVYAASALTVILSLALKWKKAYNAIPITG
ncbi:MFS general substrate transporter [Patellaria atrata CBS 101060]|uniref:MFS general substrate transporter n=1 Tax=Patellaria atrata CBS 101060 TaxID=1346257 RepID=A0A9P4S5Q2_9PEZI|nr:MFS general substrate transporter [Patellaria atrata CBS 101060]